MRIFEITKRNIDWLILQGVEPNFSKDYELLVSLVDVITIVKHTSKYPNVLAMIYDLETKIDKFLTLKLPDKLDLDITNLKNNAVKIKHHLSKLKERLT